MIRWLALPVLLLPWLAGAQQPDAPVKPWPAPPGRQAPPQTRPAAQPEPQEETTAQRFMHKKQEQQPQQEVTETDPGVKPWPTPGGQRQSQSQPQPPPEPERQAQPRPQQQTEPESEPQQAEAPLPILTPYPESLTESMVFEHPHLQFSAVPRRGGKGNDIVAWGGIGLGDTDRLRKALDQAKPVYAIHLFSNGGNLLEGLELGRLIHARNLTTHVMRGTFCISACNFAFMGGRVRYIDIGAEFKVHVFAAQDDLIDHIMDSIGHPPTSIDDFNTQYPDLRLTEKKVNFLVAIYNEGHKQHPITSLQEFLTHEAAFEIIKMVQQGSAQNSANIARFLTEMSISLRFLTDFANIPNDQPRALSMDELRDLNVVNAD